MGRPPTVSGNELRVVRAEAPGAPEPSVFLSHSSEDGTGHAERLDRELRRHGIVTWLSVRDVDESLDFTSELEHAIEEADVFVACITSGVMRADSYVRREIVCAQMCGKRIAVARFAPIRPPISVVTNTFFEFSQDWDAAFTRLLVFCQGGQTLPEPMSGPPGVHQTQS